MTILSIKFHRNGVHGRGFYAVTFLSSAYTEGKIQYEYLATFETDENDRMILHSCRVIQLSEIRLCWRGDEIGFDLVKKLDQLKSKQNKQSIYDLTLANQY